MNITSGFEITIKPIAKPKRIKKTKTKTKSLKQNWTSKNDVSHSIAVRTRDNFKCQKEGCRASGKNMQCAHIFTRSRVQTRWDIDNGITLCYYHHLLWAHRSPVEFTLWCIEKLGKKKFEELRKKSISTDNKIGAIEMQKINETLKKKINELSNKNRNKPF